MRVLVPFDARDPKTGLASVLDDAERRAFADAMLADVLETLAVAGHDARVLATAPVECVAPVTVDERPLTPAVNAALADAELPLAVVMADLALLTPAALTRLVEPDADVVIAPGIGGGTNALVVRHPGFRVDYHGASYRDHRERAADCRASLATVDSFRLAADVDDPSDFVELLLHGEGRARDWLREAGFEVVASDGRMTARRRDDTD
ncbi:2-phospho-L-lactate guanylyltransferase [Halobacteriales archaeon SW_7_65_23]|nr:MAG: 2-phospho-L-lactate guanylyltransferase [Halobacteriales archaeon SW_7_65_23]